MRLDFMVRVHNVNVCKRKEKFALVFKLIKHYAMKKYGRLEL
jgi:hypothetical protein